MKTIILLLFATQSVAQITITKVPKNPVKNIEKYDSSTDYVSSNKFYVLIGQELYVKSLGKSLQKYGYDHFLKKLPSEIKVDYNHYTRNENIFRCCQGDSHHSNYVELNGHYFSVLDTVTERRTKYLKLQEKESKEIAYYEYCYWCETMDLDHYGSDSRFPFIVVGRFLKEKKKWVGKKFIVTSKYADQMIDIHSGKNVRYIKDEIWKCVDVTIAEENNRIMMILDNSQGDQILAGRYDAEEVK